MVYPSYTPDDLRSWKWADLVGEFDSLSEIILAKEETIEIGPAEKADYVLVALSSSRIVELARAQVMLRREGLRKGTPRLVAQDFRIPVEDQAAWLGMSCASGDPRSTRPSTA